MKHLLIRQYLLLFGVILTFYSCSPENPVNGKSLQIAGVRAGTVLLSLTEPKSDIPLDANIYIEFSSALDTTSVEYNLALSDGSSPISFEIAYMDNNKTIVLDPEENMSPLQLYTLSILEDIHGAQGESFPGIEYNFTTKKGELEIRTITLNENDFNTSSVLTDIDFADLTLEIIFSDPLDPESYQSFFTMSGQYDLIFSLLDNDTKVTINLSNALKDYTKYYFSISSNLHSINEYAFEGFSNYFYTSLDSSYKFPELSDSELLDKVQQNTLKYFYDFAHPASGMARERNTSGDLVTSGGSGFGLMALVSGIERGYVSRPEGLTHLEKILDFLESCDRYHGAWPHWINGNTGKVHPFSQKDDGADLVETSFLIQGLITVRQYLNENTDREKILIERINVLWKEVEWDWFTRDGQNVLYWHWSPNYGWDMNMQIRGYNETLITYVMAASSPTHSIDAAVYHSGYARNGGILNGKSFYGITLPVGYDYGGPLFFSHYSFLGLDPRNLTDQYASYWEQNVNHSLINQAHSINNPNNYIGYSKDCWGLTASDGNQGYSAHSPTNDRGVITPTAALSSLPYTPEQSMQAIRHFYYLLGDKLWGEYGFYDAFNIKENWWADSYLAIDQGPIVVMIENYRTGLLWDLFMSAPEVQTGLLKLGFSNP